MSVKGANWSIDEDEFSANTTSTNEEYRDACVCEYCAEVEVRRREELCNKLSPPELKI